MIEQLILKTAKKFRQDVKRLKKQSKDLNKLKEVIQLLTTNQKLDETYLDHSLKGDYINCRECHVGPDWLLIYFIRGKYLNLARTGSHPELFK